MIRLDGQLGAWEFEFVLKTMMVLVNTIGLQGSFNPLLEYPWEAPRSTATVMM